MNSLPFGKQAHVISALVDGCSIRATERMTGVHRDTIMRLGIQVGEGCRGLHDGLMGNLHVNLLELDEIWAYVGKHQRRLKPEDHAEFGDQYTYLGMDAIRKAIISYEVGRRAAATTRRFVKDLRSRVVNRPQISTDGYEPYVEAVRLAFGSNVDYGMLVKAEGDKGWGSAAGCRGAQRVAITGSPDLDCLTTNRIERQNLTVRMNVRRFMRKTNAFSKRLRSHKAAVALYVAHYNFCRVHEALKTTPALALGVANHVWPIGELLEVALSIVPRQETEPEAPTLRPDWPVPRAPSPGAGQLGLFDEAGLTRVI